MGRHRLRTLSSAERNDEVSVGNFLSRCVENIEDSNPENPADSMYLVDMAGYTCMDYFESSALGNDSDFPKFNTKGRLTITDYEGRNAWLRNYLRKYGRYTSTISNALIELYHKNPFIRDTDNHCTYENYPSLTGGGYLNIERTIKRTNCLSNTLQYLQNNLKSDSIFNAYHRLLDNIVATPEACNSEYQGNTRKESCIATILDHASMMSRDSNHTALSAGFLMDPKIDMLEQKCYSTIGDSTQKMSCFERIINENDFLMRKMLDVPSSSRNFFNYMGVRSDYTGYSFPVTGYQYLMDYDMGRFLNTVSNAESEFEKSRCYTRSGLVSCQDTLLGMMGSTTDKDKSKSILTYILSKFKEYELSFTRTKYNAKLKSGESVEIPVIDRVVDEFVNISTHDSTIRDKIYAALVQSDLSHSTCIMRNGDISNCITKILMYGDSTALAYMFDAFGADNLKKEKCFDMRGDLTSCIDAFFQRLDYAENANDVFSLIDKTRLEYHDKRSKSRSDERRKEYSALYDAESAAQNKYKSYVNNVIAPTNDWSALSKSISDGSIDIVRENCRVPRIQLDLDAFQNDPSVLQYLLAAQESEEKARRARSAESAAKHAASAAENKTISELIRYIVASKKEGREDIEIIATEALNFFSIVAESNRRIAVSKSPRSIESLKSQRNAANLKYTYLHDYLKEITSTRPKTTSCIQRSFDMIEKSAGFTKSGVDVYRHKGGVYSIVDAIRKNAENARVKYDLVQSRCLGSDGSRLPCIQKYIDVVMNYGKYYTGERSIAGVFSIPSAFKQVCRDENNKFINCIDYAVSNYGSDILGGSESVSILLNEDFSNIRKHKVTLKDGSQITLGQLVCQNVTVKEVHERLLSMGRVRRENYNIYGTALDLVAKCKCSDKSPLENWICTNKACFESTVNKRRHPWAERFFDPKEGMKPRAFMGDSDWLGIAGTYDILKPSMSYEEMSRYNTTATNALNLAVVDLQLTPGIINVEVVKPPLGEISGYTIHNAFVRDYALRITTGAETRLIAIGDIEKDSVVDNQGNTVHLVSAISADSMNAIRNAAKTRPSQTGTPLKLIISNRPYDMMRATSCQMWPSCFNLESGAYANAIPSYMYSGSYIAYIASSEYPTTWLARAWLLPIEPRHKPANAKACVYIGRIYGDHATILKDGLQVIFRSKQINVDGCPNDDSMTNRVTINYLRNSYHQWEGGVLRRRCEERVNKEIEDIIEMIESSPLSVGAKEDIIQKEQKAISSKYECSKYTDDPTTARFRSSPFLDDEQRSVIYNLSDNNYFSIYSDPPSVPSANTDNAIVDIINRNISNFVGITPKKLVIK